MLSSLSHYVTGLAVGAGAGIALGLLSGMFRWFEAATAWIVRLLRPIPGLAWVPFAIIWFGVQPEAAVFIIAIGVFWIVFFAAQGAIRGVDRDLIEDRLSAMHPLWVPGQGSGYHPITYGFVADAIARRVTGKSVGGLLRDEIAGPRGIDFHIGTPEALHDRTAEHVLPPKPPFLGKANDAKANADAAAKVEAEAARFDKPIADDEPEWLALPAPMMP